MKNANSLVGGVILGFLAGMLLLQGFSRVQFFQKVGQFSRDLVDPPPLVVDAAAPDFILANLADEPIQLENLRGKVVLINFWATWCGPCRLEMPALQSRYEKFSNDLAILAVNEQDKPEEIQAFMEELNLTFDVLLDTSGEVHQIYQVRGFPTTYLVDPSGFLRVQHVGVMSENQLDRYLEKVGLRE